jgi:hypothetical protein
MSCFALFVCAVLLSALLRDSPICAFSQSLLSSPPPTRLRLLQTSPLLSSPHYTHCVARLLTARCYDSAPLPLPCSCSICPICMLLPHSALLAVLPRSAVLHQFCYTAPLRPVRCSPLLLSSLPCPATCVPPPLRVFSVSTSLLPPLARFLISVDTTTSKLLLNYF